MHKIDPSFRQAKVDAKRRRRNRVLLRLAGVAGMVSLAGIGTGVYYTWDYWRFGPLDQELVPIEFDELGGNALPDKQFVPVIADLPGDPLLISVGNPDGSATRTLSMNRPKDLEPEVPVGTVMLLIDKMISTSERFMTTLPSSQQDFAFFQARSNLGSATLAMAAPDTNLEPIQASLPGEAGDLDPGAGWGETLDNTQEALPEFERTRVENTTSIALTNNERERFNPLDDILVKALGPRKISDLLIENGYAADVAAAAENDFRTIFGVDQLETGYVLAARTYRTARNGSPQLVQLSVYDTRRNIGSIALSDDGTFRVAADAWVRDELFTYTGTTASAGSAQQYRLLDAIYSTLARNGVPTGVVGEAIMHLSRSADLNLFANPDDEVMLVYAPDGRDGTQVEGRVLYVGVRGDGKSIDCFVFKRPEDSGYSCFDENAAQQEVTVVDGMVTPVDGLMTSKFGPRKHPILNTVRIHKGVDWAAPTGTPIRSAFDGVIAFAGDGQGYGNLVRVSHAGGRETRYAHMSRFGDLAVPGTQVKAGDIIGYVGTTGLSTGPHLHFELYVGGEAVDPLASTAVAAAAPAAGSNAGAVEALVNKIIQVESAGNARAKNPLSTATGLGQFIESTWLRMMRTYRPDLVASLSREQILELRFDPTISREMVRNLAREGESYLRARGHAITAGRLYLAHFLGMDGAHIALSSPDDAQLIDVFGASVIKANPFLTGKTVAYVKEWAERKMSGRSRAPIASTPEVTKLVVRKESPEFKRYKEAMTAFLKTASPSETASAVIR